MNRADGTKARIAPERLKKLRAAWLVCTALLLGGVLYAVFMPAPEGEVRCLSLRFFEVHCSACGLTRCAYHLVRGRVAAAFYSNMFAVATLPLWLYVYASLSASIITGRQVLPPVRFTPALVITLAAAFLLFGILRNVPALEVLTPR